MDPADSIPPTELSGTVHQIRTRTLEATSRLLGDTIAMSDADWQQPSALNWWTRAHVATHVARNADGLRSVMEGYQAHRPRMMYESEDERRNAVERGSLRAGLDIQIDLDTSAGQLSEHLNQLPDTQPDPEVDLVPGVRARLSQIPLIRLNEVVLHHADLLLGFTIEHVPHDVARWLLEWRCHVLTGEATWPALVVASDSGLVARIGAEGPTTTIEGTDAQLLGWLVGRPTEALPSGTEALKRPTPA